MQERSQLVCVCGGGWRTRDEAVRWTCWVPGPSDDLKKNQFLM